MARVCVATEEETEAAGGAQPRAVVARPLQFGWRARRHGHDPNLEGSLLCACWRGVWSRP